MASREQLRSLLTQRRFRALLATRLTSQAADGVFQASLVSAVVFDPTHAAGPRQIATGFVVLLLPYSLVGPFAGVFLDRWRRQRVLVAGALVRSAVVVLAAGLLVRQGPTGAGFTGAALVALSVNRFYLAALSAGLPAVVRRHDLVVANALSPTAGTLVTIVGGLAGLGVRAAAGRGADADAVVAVLAAAGYAAAALVASRLPAGSLGPVEPDRSALGARLAGVVTGMVAGARHVAHRVGPARALAVITAQRLLYGLWTVMTVLLYRNSFTTAGLLRSGLTGLGQVVTAGGIGLVAAAAVTPWATVRLGLHRWVVTVTALAAVLGLLLEAPVSPAGQLGSAMVLGFATQSTKVCVDTQLQRGVDDEVLGRVFAFYDTLFNLSFVVAAMVAATVLPASGRSRPAVVAMAVGFAVVAAAYALSARRDGSVPEQAPEQALATG